MLMTGRESGEGEGEKERREVPGCAHGWVGHAGRVAATAVAAHRWAAGASGKVLLVLLKIFSHRAEQVLRQFLGRLQRLVTRHDTCQVR